MLLCYLCCTQHMLRAGPHLSASAGMGKQFNSADRCLLLRDRIAHR